MRRPGQKLEVPAFARAAASPMFAALTFAALLATAACTDPPRAADPKDNSAVEPDVFDVIRASNSKQAVERLRDRYHEEVEHAKLLEARIGEAIAAEEALSAEQRQRLESLQKIRDEVRILVDQNATLEKQLAAEIARRDELKKKIDQAQADAAAAAKPADGKAPGPSPAGKKDGG
jgi:predicted RNase H-like nuclease (RuvC/YqgF family)